MKFFDDKSKKLKWWNRNYLYIGSILFIALNILIFALGKGGTYNLEKHLVPQWDIFDEINNLFFHFCGNFTHSSWDHVLQNMLGFSFCFVYMERKFGTVNFLAILFTLTLFCSFPYIEETYIRCGSSIVWFACFGFVFVDYLFSFRKKYRNVTNIIVGAISIILEYVRSGFYDDYSSGTRVIKWGFNPVQFTEQTGHAVGIIVGLCVGLFMCMVILIVDKSKEKQV